MLLLLLKLTIFLLAGLGALAMTKNASAARRHMLCVGTLVGSLLLPLAALIPVTAQFNIRAAANPATRALTGARAAGIPWLAVIEVVWATGTALLLLRLAIGHRRLARAANVSTPMAAGLVHPAILLPRDFETWPEERQTAVLRHEQAHIDRRDLWANLLGNLACAAWWFHPLVWIMNAQMRNEQETACDDAVLRSGFDRAAYAEALLAVSRVAPALSVAGCGMTSKLDLKSRITRLLTADAAATSRRRIAAASVAMVIAFAVLGPLGAQTIYKVGGDVTSPSVLSRIDPEYSEEARAAKVQGTVVLQCVIQPDGMAHDINVVRGVGYGLDEQAMKAVMQWKFVPGQLKGEPVTVSVTIEVNFKLQ